MAGHLTNKEIPYASGQHSSPGFTRRLRRWSTSPVGMLTLQLGGMAAALALGFGLARSEYGEDVLHAGTDLETGQTSQLRRSLDRRHEDVQELARRNAELMKRADEQDLDQEIAAAQIGSLREQNEKLKQASEIFRSARQIVLPRTPAPLPIRVPQATVVAIKQGAKEGVVPDGEGGFMVVRRPSPTVNDALKKGLKKPSLIAALAPPAASAKSFDLRGPIGTALRQGPVTLSWAKVPGATDYSVVLHDEKGTDALGGQGDKIAAAETPFGDQWTTPVSLGPGTYQWQVIANMPEGAEAKTLSAGGRPASFAILDNKRSAELKTAEARFAGNALELGVTYARLGLLDDAEAALIPFVAAYPDSPQTKRLLQQIRGWRKFRL